jgi:hypothetical protein
MVLALDEGRWIPTVSTGPDHCYKLVIDSAKAGMSGSPILNAAGGQSALYPQAATQCPHRPANSWSLWSPEVSMGSRYSRIAFRGGSCLS